MRWVYDIPETAETKISRSSQRDARLVDELIYEVSEAYSARRPQESDWEEELKGYEACPRTVSKNIPFERAPNIVISLGAIACDALYAQATDLIWAIDPMVTVRAGETSDEQLSTWRRDNAKDYQSWMKKLARDDLTNIRSAWDHSALDDIQLGTGIIYCPWIETTRKAKSYMVMECGPKILPVPVEDFLIPGGYVHNLDTTRWVSMRSRLTPGELSELSKKKKWSITGIDPVATPGFMRSQRETLGRTRTTKMTGALCELQHTFIHFDYDQDGLDEDLLCIWDQHSGRIAKLVYNPFDCRPFKWARYQKRAHMGYGLGVMRMALPYQEEVSEKHNDRSIAEKVAYMAIFRGKAGTAPGGRVTLYHGKFFEAGKDDFERVPLGEPPRTELAESEQLTISLFERRVGSAEVSSPRPSALLGGRTPGITALSVMQQANRRFTPAFDDLRFMLAGGLIQCAMRYREQLLKGNKKAAENILRQMGPTSGRRIIKMLMSDHFEDGFDVEMTASSVSINKEADRQNMLAVIGIMGQYYDRVMQLSQIAINQALDPALRSVATKVATAAGELIDRALRTFDQIRDPATFVIQIEDAVNAVPGIQPAQVQALLQILQSGGVGALAPPSQPPPAVA